MLSAIEYGLNLEDLGTELELFILKKTATTKMLVIEVESGLLNGTEGQVGFWDQCGAVRNWFKCSIGASSSSDMVSLPELHVDQFWLGLHWGYVDI